MSDLSKKTMSKNEQEEIKEIASILLMLPKEDRAIIKANANAFKVRSDLEKART